MPHVSRNTPVAACYTSAWCRRRSTARPWRVRCRAAVQRGRAWLLVGEAQDLIGEHLAVARRSAPDAMLRAAGIRRCGDLERAVTEAARLALAGDVVLLSPACASYDQ